MAGDFFLVTDLEAVGLLERLSLVFRRRYDVVVFTASESIY
jgi:hypothetical protein